MASKIVIKNGIAEGVYDDRLLPIYKALGSHMRIERASEVEFNHDLRMWVARELSTGQVIASAPNRSEVLKREVEILEGKLGD